MDSGQPEPTTPTTRRSGVFYGWWVLGIISFMAALNNAFYNISPTLFLIPVGISLGLNRATVSLIFSLGRAEGALYGPVVGYLVDRFGARKLLVIGTILTGIGFIVFALAPNLWIFALAYLGFLSLGATMAFQDSATAMLNNWFSRYRVRAMSIREATGNLGSTILIPLLTLIIAGYDWRIAAFIGAAAYLVLILPITPFLKESPESIGLLPDGANPEAVKRARAAAAQTGSAEVQRLRSYYDAVDFRVREALRTSTFWYLLTGTMLRQVARVGIDLHYVAILQWRDLDVSVAALILSLRLGVNVPSKLAVGYFSNRVSKPLVLSGGMVLYTVGLVLLLSFHAVWVLVIAAVISGMAEGITPLNWGAIGDYFGRRHYATLRGIINLSYSWALLLVPFATGWWFDHHASYTVPIAISVVASVASMVVYALLRPPKRPTRLAAAETGQL